MPFTVVVCTNGSAMRTRARVRCAGVNFKEWLDEKRSGGMVYILRVEQVFHLAKGTRYIVIPVFNLIFLFSK
jgi:hypothetical protein